MMDCAEQGSSVGYADVQLVNLQIRIQEGFHLFMYCVFLCLLTQNLDTHPMTLAFTSNTLSSLIAVLLKP